MRRLTLILVLIAGLLSGGQSVASPPPSANFIAILGGSGEVPPRDTDARGVAIFHFDGTVLRYRLIASNIDNVVASHIHLGAADINGPVVQFLAGNFAPGGGAQNGVLAEGTITGADLIGPLAGQGLGALRTAMHAGNTYVNVHTNDGVAPINTGPGDFPGGEIRGQIRENGSD